MTGSSIYSLFINDVLKLNTIPIKYITIFEVNREHNKKNTYIGNIGLPIICQFNWIIDYSTNTIYFKSNNNYNPINKYTSSGIRPKKINDSILVIKGIIEGTDAYEKGLRINDTILEINNIKASDWTFLNYSTLHKIDKANIKIKRRNSIQSYQINRFVL